MTRRGRTHFAGRIVAITVGVALCAAVVPRIGGPTDQASATATFTVARYDMNEAAGSAVLVDSSGNGLNGTIGSDVVHPITYLDGVGHRFPLISPDTTITYPNHDDRVPENAMLDPGTDDYAITVRYRKTTSFGNLLQKGQNTVTGGYFKIEMPGHTASCLFKDSTGKTGGVTSPPELDMSDGAWHVLRCERLQAEVNMWVDGVEVAKTASALGNIDNTWPLVFGGKIDCNPPAPGVTCDYYSGDIDYAQFDKGDGVAANVNPHAAFTQSQSAGVFTFNAATSTDSDGTIVSYAWDFGDGTTGTGVTVTHTYATAGKRTVTLTVTDNDGGLDDKSQVVTAPAPPTTTTSSTTTTSTIVAQLPPEGLTVVPEAAQGGAPAKRGEPFDATQDASPTGG